MLYKMKTPSQVSQYFGNRKDNLKIEFEVFQTDIYENPKDIILNLKKELLNIL